jgi:biotin-(acetyl-CoA carboxylase) ligase
MNTDYNNRLLGIHETRKFKIDKEETEGTIKGVDSSGRLIVQLNQGERSFDIKEIECVY